MAFQQGLSGLRVSSKAIDVTSHNIANTGTVGYKSSRANFADMYANSMGSKTSTGFGAKTIAVQQQFFQGGLTATNNALDLAINGGGFFVMQAPNGETTYTRNGEFHLDNEGYIVNDTGHFLTGYQADATGMIKEGIVDKIKVTNENIEPKQTSKMMLGVNLNSSDKIPTKAWVGIDAGNVGNPDVDTYNNTTSVNIFDSLGNPHVLSFYFIRGTGDPATAPTDPNNTWTLKANVDGTSDTYVTFDPEITKINFDANGKLDENSRTALQNLQVNVNINSVYTDLKAVDPNISNNIVQDPDTGILTFTLDMSNSTQFSADFNVTDLTQDGYAPGYAVGLSISDKGVVMQNYSNGESKDIGQVVLASFINENGLLSAGNNQWKATRDSGPAKVGTALTASLGGIESMQIEESNVDLTNELVNLIVFQRNYQANAKSITTQDTLLQTVINMT